MLAGECTKEAGCGNIVGVSQAIRNLRLLIARVGARECTVLIQGESGTGKELVAQSLHEASPRAAGPCVIVDCATLHDTLLESQLFGHARGAFTGAVGETTGFIRAADGGTLFLDEIGELDAAVQAKLLRFLQEKTVTPVGAVSPVFVDVRVLAATHYNLEQLVRQRRFREDLFFRLNVMVIHTTPLRERCDDIPVLVDHFLRRFAELYHEPIGQFATDALAMLASYHWPGNVRELANAVEHAMIVAADGRPNAQHLPPRIRGAVGVSRDAAPPALSTSVVPLDHAQRQLIVLALNETEGHEGRAAQLLQIERRRLYRLVRRYGLKSMTRTGRD
ncbi:MAG: sigma-54 dependent transcriptional regulator [Planctomycetes bacterium]|jgi:two-component system response regulator HydG|nr:sigma-54 dependent transcriptional regulator [Planctomycetota bacterium]